MIIKHLKQYGKVKSKNFLWNKLSDALLEKQKGDKIDNFMIVLKESGVIDIELNN